MKVFWYLAQIFSGLYIDYEQCKTFKKKLHPFQMTSCLSSMFFAAISHLRCFFFLPLPFVFVLLQFFSLLQSPHPWQISSVLHPWVVANFAAWKSICQSIFWEYFFLSFHTLNFKWKLFLMSTPLFSTKLWTSG